MVFMGKNIKPSFLLLQAFTPEQLSEFTEDQVNQISSDQISGMSLAGARALKAVQDEDPKDSNPFPPPPSSGKHVLDWIK